MPPTPRLPSWLPAAILGLAALVAYSNTFTTPFVFDDQFAIIENPSIKHLGDIRAVLSPPPYASGAAGRPLVNLSLALNYAAGGLDVRGYHAVNLLLHTLCALTLFGILRRTLERSGTRKRFGFGDRRIESNDAGLIALLATLVWTVHPLLTESVTCVIQRDEVLSGLLYLLSLYLFIRYAEHPKIKWAAGSIATCLLGVTAKELVVSLPLIALLYDRTFISGAFRRAWEQRRGVYLGLAASWILLAWLMLGSQQRGGTVGFGLGVSSWEYLLTQCRAIVLYLQLSVWPHPLTIDYGTDVVRSAREVIPQGCFILALTGAALVSLRRPSASGFLGLFFFAILAPSSSVVPLVSQPIAEHRMYLPLAAIVVLAVTAVWAVAGRRSLLVWPALAVLLCVLTFRRNADYHSELTLIEGALQANPRNDRAYLNRGSFEAKAGQTSAAIADFRTALALQPAAADTEFDLAAVLDHSGDTPAAVPHYQRAVQLRPAYPLAQYSLGLALARTGRMEEAAGPLQAALRLQPGAASVKANLALVYRNLGIMRATAGRMAEAIPEFEAALRLDPQDEQSRQNLKRAQALTAGK